MYIFDCFVKYIFELLLSCEDLLLFFWLLAFPMPIYYILTALLTVVVCTFSHLPFRMDIFLYMETLLFLPSFDRLVCTIQNNQIYDVLIKCLIISHFIKWPIINSFKCILTIYFHMLHSLYIEYHSSIYTPYILPK